MQVAEALKGAASDRLTLTQLGGEVDGVRYNVPGCPAFRPGEQALLFVWRDARGRAQVNAMAQGKFDIRTDPSTHERLVQRSAPGFGVRDVKTLRVLAAGQPSPRLRYDDLVREIRRTLAEQTEH